MSVRSERRLINLRMIRSKDLSKQEKEKEFTKGFTTGHIAFGLHVLARFCAGRRHAGCPIGYDLSHRRPAAVLVCHRLSDERSAQRKYFCPVAVYFTSPSCNENYQLF